MFSHTLGFTGTIASGKSVRVGHVAQLIRRCLASTLGSNDPCASPAFPFTSVRVEVINADTIGHDLYRPGTACYHEIVEAFGTGVLATTTSVPSSTPAMTSRTPIISLPPINRRALGNIVFADDSELAKLNRICRSRLESRIVSTHETILQDASHRETAAVRGSKISVVFILLEAALLMNIPKALHLCDALWVTHCDRNTAINRVIRRDNLDRDAATKRVDIQPNLQDVLETIIKGRGFERPIFTLDTGNNSSLEQGLDDLTQRFQQYWKHEITPSLSSTLQSFQLPP